MFTPKSQCRADILVVDDEPPMRRYLQTLLETDGHHVNTAGSGADALRIIDHGPKPDLVLLDLLMPGLDGLQTLQQMRQIRPALRVVMLSCVHDSRKVVQAVRMGAADYVTKPFRTQDLDSVLEPLIVPRLSNPASDGEVVEEVGDGVFFVAASPEMHKLRAQAERIARVDIPVLLLGESGTGKEVLARVIHHASPRASAPFLKINCAAVPEDLLESELFGYEPGAFTGATRIKPGKFELCNKGTILLDEIGEISPALQAKLLHVLQDGQFSRLGGRSIIKADVRVIAATNVDVGQALASGRLRRDLYYRLSGVTLRLPPLRERKRDIGLLFRYLMASLAERFACPPLPISQAEIEACMTYSWPGNVRELENFVKRCLVLRDFAPPSSELSVVRRTPPQESTLHFAIDPGGLKSLARSARENVELHAIIRALEQTNWNRTQAASQLKISYKALLYKIRQYGIDPHAESRSLRPTA
jgi:two-component system, NtrC family, response regulator AtoC